MSGRESNNEEVGVRTERHPAIIGRASAIGVPIASLTLLLTLAMLLSLAGPASAYYLDTRSGTRRALHVDRPEWAAAGDPGAIAPIESERANWTFGANVPVAQGSGNYLWPDAVILPDGKLYASWMDDRTGTYHIYGALTVDGGHTWSTDQRIDDAPAAAMARFVSLAALGSDRVAAVWEDVRAGGWNWNVYFSRGTWNAGAGHFDWSPAVRVNTTGGSTDASSYMHPSVATDRFGRVHVAWTDWRDGVFNQVWFRSSPDSGTSWGTEVRISDRIGYQPVAGDPCIAVDAHDASNPPTLLCVWNDWRGNVPGGRYPNVYFARSTDGGATWLNPNVRVNDVTDYYQQVAKRVVTTTTAGSIAVGWYNDDFVGASEMRVSLSTNHGATWSASTALSDPLTGSDVCPTLAGGVGNDLLASWSAYTTDWNLYFRASTDGGANWSGIQRADDDATGAASSRPIIAVTAGGDPILASQDTRPTYAWSIWCEPGVRDPAAVDAGDLPVAPGVTIGPNPSHGAATIRWNLSGGDWRRLRIVDIGGRLVLERTMRGEGTVRWGRGVPAGLYGVSVDGPSIRESRKIIMLP
jgi:hypothetical protein